MDAKLTALETAYEEAKRSHGLLQEQLTTLRAAGDLERYYAAFRASEDGRAVLEEATRLLDQ